tara:strand:+ start:296 stop:397 length:102 start_codon:yes stop_codon:yes gene_type:complete
MIPAIRWAALAVTALLGSMLFVRLTSEIVGRAP